jgi:hypothetical protein
MFRLREHIEDESEWSVELAGGDDLELVRKLDD